jgi:hypothetical protein
MQTRTYVLLTSLALCVAGALTSTAQAPPPNLPASTVYGRLGIGSGPGQAIPFGTLLSNLFNGASPFTAHSVLIGEGTAPVAGATTGTAGQLLIDQGAAADPLFQPSSGDVTNTAGGVFTIAAGAVTGAKTATNTLANSNLAQMAANGFKGNNAGASQNVADLTVPQAMALLNASQVGFSVSGVNFNSANTDNAVTIAFPTGATSYRVLEVRISNASASLSTSTWGLFSATGGGGTAVFAAGQTNTITTASANTNNNGLSAAPATSGTQFYNFTTLYFRVGTAQGSAATGDVLIDVRFNY